MKFGPIAVRAVAAFLVLSPQARAEAPSTAAEEAAYLIGVVEASGCAFFRNGMRYDAARAAAHLREKYALVATGGAIATGEMFIEKVATKSAFTGLSYEIDCPGHARVTVAFWLSDALARHRAKEAPR